MKSAATAANGVTGRLAPSPTGLLHLGNAWAFLLAWLSVRLKNGRLVLRLEDIDPQRSKPEFAVAVTEDLAWLGLDWDQGPIAQSSRLELYAETIDRLLLSGQAYPCYCSRQELKSLAGAPQAGDLADPPYSGLCRNLSSAERAARRQIRRPAIRLFFPPEAHAATLAFDDLILGPQQLAPQTHAGDFAIQRSDKVIAYQLAAALDDIHMGITEVVRGGDILSSTPRQLLIFRLFNATPPTYAHLPLLLDHEGERLAKRHAALTLRALRASGIPAANVVGYLAFLGGLQEVPRPLSASELLDRYAAFDDKNRFFSLLPAQMPPLPPDAAAVIATLH